MCCRGGSKRVRQHGWCASTASLGWGLNFNGGSVRVLTWLRQWRSIVTVQLVPGPRRRLGVPAFFQDALCNSSAQHHSTSGQSCSARYPHTAFVCRSCLHPASSCPPRLPSTVSRLATASLSCTPTKVAYPAQPACQSPLSSASYYFQPWISANVLAYVLSLSR